METTIYCMKRLKVNIYIQWALKLKAVYVKNAIISLKIIFSSEWNAPFLKKKIYSLFSILLFTSNMR